MSIHDIDRHANPSCDADCTRQGWTEAFIDLGPALNTETTHRLPIADV